MNIFNSFLFISIILSVIPALLSKGLNECGKQAGKCNFDFHTNNSKEGDHICGEIIETLHCASEGCTCPILNLVQRKQRLYIACGLFAYRRIEKALDGDFIEQCGLGKFLQDFLTPEECRNNPSLLTCVRSYADNVIQNEDNNAKGDAKCQALKDYADCQLKWSGAECNVTNSTVSDFASGEMERLILTDCEIEGLNPIKPTTHVISANSTQNSIDSTDSTDGYTEIEGLNPIKPTTPAISTNSTQNSTDLTDSTDGATGHDQLGLLGAIVTALAARLLTLNLK